MSLFKQKCEYCREKIEKGKEMMLKFLALLEQEKNLFAVQNMQIDMKKR